MNLFKQSAIAAVVSASMLLAGCASSGGYYGNQAPPPNQQGQQGGMSQTSKGALIGAAIGAAAGLLSGGDATERRQRALVGVGVGGLTGGAIGAYQDRQEKILRERTAGTGVDVIREGDNITLNMPSGITFAFDSANLDPNFYPVLDNVANTLREYNQTVIEVAGHTDSVGTEAYNQALSERRANAVGNYLMGKGLMRDRFIIVGAGESHPIASNETESGRAQNRRVEITLVPVRS
ncbi:outer membrane protein OmpA-like peptidoglycan-associated protein [Luteimonas cucumeris]|uniref:Outer membrane protein OmpA-like peptidoglycan-associated protein n=1 Tax=Luteimonas cucumeris TaxID=985012 RepID=A0A562L8C3_9GAMM|nr:OmpA family protein [Luteimonas cucumeris]TWI03776.1 outer membrane protein OmpA-like peptidoglycan-associated protein [Luteimonas cucumeris]